MFSEFTHAIPCLICVFKVSYRKILKLESTFIALYALPAKGAAKINAHQFSLYTLGT